eukprot:CAMPEP_0194586278 /NCGR_PEP_ID=MMETSP0292-20121207/18326_1 /TAXON_ID=39354 /ORGANISM="Heterosigma akashiwo, Strain CCMP2393" /LENGTH=115 /DNA_ID=CAMNT_0039442033 /DNA_START=547 /DNA_END=894 /DNA_ORIENTATION=+
MAEREVDDFGRMRKRRQADMEGGGGDEDGPTRRRPRGGGDDEDMGSPRDPRRQRRPKERRGREGSDGYGDYEGGGGRRTLRDDGGLAAVLYSLGGKHGIYSLIKLAYFGQYHRGM